VSVEPNLNQRILSQCVVVQSDDACVQGLSCIEVGKAQNKQQNAIDDDPNKFGEDDAFQLWL